MTLVDYVEHTYQSADGLSLYARDYPCQGTERGVILCMHGLTRNSADFDPVVPTLTPHYRVIAADQRGRGRSAHDPNPENYHPGTYVADMFCLLDSLSLEKVILFGTSMGGLMATMMKAAQPKRFSAIIINDICPDIAPQGLARIMGYVGASGEFANWQEAIDELKRLNSTVFPQMDESGWQKFAERIFVPSESGGLKFNYDPNIQQALKASPDNASPPDLWPLFQGAGETPLMLIHGEISDLLVDEGVAKFKKLVPHLHYLKVAGVGHAPLLDEPEVAGALKSFLASL